jgi:3-dehydroquinate dehydratase-2
MKFIVINGPNLNLLQWEEPGLSGVVDYDALVDYVRACCGKMEIDVEFYQSNHEGDLIDEIQSVEGRGDGIILNAGGYAQTSVAMLDALRLAGVPAVEVVLEDRRQAEPFRKQDFVALACQGRFIGEGIQGYVHAAAYLAQLIRIEAQPGRHIAN